MLLTSWRGHRQDLMEMFDWAYERKLLSNLIRWKRKRVTLSTEKARIVRFDHFSVRGVS